MIADFVASSILRLCIIEAVLVVFLSQKSASMSWADSSPGMQMERVPVDGHHQEEEGSQYPKQPSQRKKIVVVGLGMVGIAFM